MLSIFIRAINHDDIAQILAIQAACYPCELHESAATFRAKISFAPDCNWLISLDGGIVGYLFTHPWQGDTPPALDRGAAPWPQVADRYYLHDLAISPAARGLGLSIRLAEHALNWAKAQGFDEAMLVAVGNATPFWQKLGFKVIEQDSAALAKYGEASLMKKKLFSPS